MEPLQGWLERRVPRRLTPGVGLRGRRNDTITARAKRRTSEGDGEMERLELPVEIRSGRGKGAARRLRASGSVPGVVYGHGCDATSIAVSARVVSRLVGSNQIISLSGAEGLSGRLVLMKEAQLDPVSREILHCDLYAVDPSQKVEATVPLHLTGKPKGVEVGGVLEPMLRTIEVRCLPLSIPTEITVDVSELEVGDVLHARSIPLPEGIELESDPDAPVAHVIAPRAEATPGEGEAAASA
jgi:large subunit ribosomal protein L25